jgi:hypothetical protein
MLEAVAVLVAVLVVLQHVPLVQLLGELVAE